MINLILRWKSMILRILKFYPSLNINLNRVKTPIFDKIKGRELN